MESNSCSCVTRVEFEKLNSLARERGFMIAVIDGTYCAPTVNTRVALIEAYRLDVGMIDVLTMSLRDVEAAIRERTE